MEPEGTDDDTIAIRLRRDLEAELMPHEQVIWSGMPTPMACFKAASPFFLFAIPFLFFSLGWEALAIIFLLHNSGDVTSTAPGWIGPVFVIFGIPFVIAGLWLTMKPFNAYGRSNRTLHAITEMRLITLCYEAKGLTIDTITASALKEVSVSSRQGNRGNLRVTIGNETNGEGFTIDRFADWVGIQGIEDASRGAKQLMLLARNPVGASYQ